MTVIRYSQLPHDAAPPATNVVATDGTTTTYSTLTEFVDAGRPFATQAEAEAGVSTTTGMNPLRTAQEIAALGATLFATAGALAAVRVPPGGSINQVLAKASATDNDTAWVNTTSALPAVAVTDKNKTLRVDGTGTTYRYIRNPFYDPYEYGALGNNATDDTTALVATATAANANESIQAAPKGRGVIVIPPGQFKTTGLTTQNTGEKWTGLGGTLAAFAANQTVMTVAHHLCVIEDILFTSAFLPTVNFAVFKHSGGVDCTFRKLRINGGYYGIEGTTAGDSVWMDCKVTNAVGDFVYLHGYNGFWGIRNKFDGDWPSCSLDGFGNLRTAPLNSEIRGAWTSSTVVTLGEVMTANGYYHQCSQSGTTASSGTGPTAVNKNSDPVSEFTDGTAKWKTHRAVNGVGVHIESDSFINIMWMTDVTGGHISSVWLSNTVGTYAPQTVKFLDGCEFGTPLQYGMRADAADDVEVASSIVDGTILTASGEGIITNVVRGINIHHNTIRQMWRGMTISATTTGASVDFNSFGATTNWCVVVAANTNRFSIIGNMCGSSTAWGANANGILVSAGTSDEYIVALNRGYGITGTRWTDSGTGFAKQFTLNV